MEKKHIFSIFEKLFTLYTKPKLAKITPKIGFSQAKLLYHSALGEILEIQKKIENNFFFQKIFFFRVVKNYSPFYTKSNLA